MVIHKILFAALILCGICLAISEARSTCGKVGRKIKFGEENELLSPDVVHKRGFCRWKLITQPGLHLQLTFSNLSIDTSRGHFKIYDASAPGFTWAVEDIIRSLNGTRTKGFFAIFSTNVIGIQYSSPPNLSYFALTYKSVIPADGDCGYNIEAGFAKKSITSPGWPKKNYPNGLKCNWLIRAKEDTTLLLYIKRMRTNSTSDFLQVYDGNRLVTREHGVISHKKSYVSSTGQFRLYFQTDDKGTGRGFRVLYSSSNYFSAPQPKPTVSQKTIKCYNILSTRAGGSFVINQKSEVTCPPGLQCFYVEAETIQRVLGLEVTSTTNYGGCIPAGSCESSCDLMSKSLPGTEMSSCNSTCCDTDLCNDVKEPEDESPPPAGLECYTGVRTSMSTGTVVLDTVNVTNCDGGSSCLRASVGSSAYGFSVQTTFGMCIPKISCSSMTCKTMQKFLPSSALANIDLDNCDMNCCDSNLCNNMDNE